MPSTEIVPHGLMKNLSDISETAVKMNKVLEVVNGNEFMEVFHDARDTMDVIREAATDLKSGVSSMIDIIKNWCVKAFDCFADPIGSATRIALLCFEMITDDSPFSIRRALLYITRIFTEFGLKVYHLIQHYLGGTPYEGEVPSGMDRVGCTVESEEITVHGLSDFIGVLQNFIFKVFSNISDFNMDNFAKKMANLSNIHRGMTSMKAFAMWFTEFLPQFIKEWMPLNPPSYWKKQLATGYVSELVILALSILECDRLNTNIPTEQMNKLFELRNRWLTEIKTTIPPNDVYKQVQDVLRRVDAIGRVMEARKGEPFVIYL